jgi:hypothetical protein
MDPVATPQVVAAVISSAGTVLTAWLRGRARRHGVRGGRQAAGRDGSAVAGNGCAAGRDCPDDRR